MSMLAVWFGVSFIEQSFSALLASECKSAKDFKSFPVFNKVVVKFEVTLHKREDSPFVGFRVVLLDLANMLGISLGPRLFGFP